MKQFNPEILLQKLKSNAVFIVIVVGLLIFLLVNNGRTIADENENNEPAQQTESSEQQEKQAEPELPQIKISVLDSVIFVGIVAFCGYKIHKRDKLK